MNGSGDSWLEGFVRVYGADCPGCGTPLRAQATCWRCHLPIRLGLKVTESYLLAWGMALASTLAMAGFGMFLGLLVLVRPSSIHLGRPGIEVVNVLIICVGVVALLPMTTLLLRRRTFCRQSRLAQWGWAAAGATLAIGAFTAFAMMIR